MTESPTTPPEDSQLTELLHQARQHEIECQLASVPFRLLRPATDYQPVITAAEIEAFMSASQAGAPQYIYVYQDADSFVVGADYATYFLYKASQVSDVPCIVLDPKPSELLSYSGESFLPPATDATDK